MRSTVVARLACIEPVARRLLAVLGESLDGAEAVCAAFEDARGQWWLAVYFRERPDEQAVRALVVLAEGDADAMVFEPLADADWVAQSLAGLRPVRAGRFVMHGAHDRTNVPVNALAIEIEAALAFGTGHHGSTRGCLLALDVLARRRRARRVLDVGTGSGVLAIAAAKVGRTRVVACDIDPVAVTSAKLNARVNGVASFIAVLRATGTLSRRVAQNAPYDLIFANILLGPIMRLAVPLARLACPGAHLVLSGLMPAQANGVLAIYCAQGFTLERRFARDGWMTLIVRRKRNRPGRGSPERVRR